MNKATNKAARKTAKKPPKKRLSVKRPIVATDLYDFEIVTSVAMSPDEKHIAYTVESIDSAHRKYFSHIHLHDLTRSSCRQFTTGEISDRSVVWSHDGRSLAFISTRNRKSGIYVMPSAGGAERKIVEMDGSFGDLAWYPDDSRLLFSFQKNDSFDEQDEKKKTEEPAVRHITRFQYRLDGAGFLPKDYRHIWSVDIKGGKATQLTRHKYEHESPCLSPDGKRLYYMANTRKDPDRDSYYTDIFVMPAKGGTARLLATPAGPKLSLSISPNGETLVYVGHDEPNDGWGIRSNHLWTLPANGRGSAKNIIPRWDRHVEDNMIGDIGESATPKPQFSRDGKKIFFLSSDTGSTHLFYVPLRGGLPTRITHDPQHVRSFSINGAGRTAALVRSDLGATPEVFTIPTQWKADKHLRQRTGVNSSASKKMHLGRTREVWIKCHDEYEVQGFLTLPPNFNPRKKYPAVLQIHGGPRAQYGHTFFFEMNYLAAAGFVVLYTNPRGGAGRGELFAGAICGTWGDIDYKDVMSAADYLENLPYVNPKKMGVAGGSYGGFMTNWVIGHTNRFRAAVTQRCMSDTSSFTGSSDIGWELRREFDGMPWDNFTNHHHRSPLTHIGKHVTTPLLIIHSEKDLRCSIEQAEQLFVKMKWLKKTVEFLRFPDESHGMPRHGRPDRRVLNWEWIRKWFVKYLK